MTQPMSWGPSRTGQAEVIRGANIAQEDNFPGLADSTTDSGVKEFSVGEWAVIDANGFAAKSLVDGELCAYPVVTGKERADVRGSKGYTLLLGSGYWLETSGWNSTGFTADDFPAGTECKIKNGKLEPADSGDFVLAIVKRAPAAQQTAGQRALGRTGFTTLLVEVGPRGYKA